MTEWPFDPAAVAVGAIDDDQHAAVADALRRDTAFAAEVADYQRLVAQLESLPGVAWDPIPPPPLDVGAITRATSTAPDEPRRSASHRTRRVLLAAAAVVVLAVAAVAVRAVVQRDDVTTARTVQLEPLADEPPTVDAQVSLPLGRSDEVGEQQDRLRRVVRPASPARTSGRQRSAAERRIDVPECSGLPSLGSREAST